MPLYQALRDIHTRPAAFSTYTTDVLWNDPHISRRMLDHHLDGGDDLSSYRSGTIDRSIGWLTGEVGIGPGTRVLDLGCGPGRYAHRLAGAGAAVTGVDLSERSIRYAVEAAERTATEVTYLRGNYLDTPIPGTFDVATMISCDFCALGPAHRQRLLGRLAGLLRPGGRFIFDAYGLAALRDRTESVAFAPDLMDGFWSADPYFGFRQSLVYPDERVTLDRYDIIEEHRTWTVYNWLQYFDPAALSAELDRAGLDLETLLADVTGAPFDPDGAVFAAIAVNRG